MASGDTTTIKIYYKGAEFAKHDFKVIKKFLKNGDTNELFRLQRLANDIIRCEVEIKPPTLRKFGKKILTLNTKNITKQLMPTVEEINMLEIIKIYDKEVEKLMKNKKNKNM